MHIWTDLNKLPTFRRAVVTIGSFDGVHHGHQRILERLGEIAAAVDGETVVITFEPHPRLVIAPDDGSLRLLQTIEEKCRLLAACGVAHTVVVPFTKAFSEQSPAAYIRDFLVRYFAPHTVVIGYDHHFGKDRAGDLAYLTRAAVEYGFAVVEISRLDIDAIAVSSTKIRKALEAHDLVSANALLGHRFTFGGIVVRGDQIGRTIGYPTANIVPNSVHQLIPADGIYAVRVHLPDPNDPTREVVFGGMLYIGTRPVVRGTERRIEVNIFEFSSDVYGQTLRLEFVAYLRGDLPFTTLDALKTQLADDAIAAKIALQQAEYLPTHL